jgi:hypothetical protein
VSADSRPALTVLTTPIAPMSRRAYSTLRSVGRRVLTPGNAGKSSSPYPGHYALVRSVVEGLRSIGASFNFNPVSFSQLARIVYAPANEALIQAADLKRRGQIDFLVAGPVNALFADECDGILQLPQIDLLIVASEWTRMFYRDRPELLQKTRVCPCGVDAQAWKPTARNKPNSALVYWKSGDERFCEQVEAIVRRCGLEPLRLRSVLGAHDAYTPAAYRELLEQSVLAVFLSTFETQGIALAEAWSMDVPTVVWDPQGETEWRGHRFAAQSSAPYLTSSTGVAIRDVADLESAIAQALATLGSFHPRDWVLRNLTDAICSATLFDVIMREAGGAMERAEVARRAEGTA